MSFKQYLTEAEKSSTEEALKDKAKESGISYGILKKVFDRGVGAYKTNFASVRPWVKRLPAEAGKKVWGFARVNAFINKGTTWKTADSDLADKVKKK